MCRPVLAIPIAFLLLLAGCGESPPGTGDGGAADPAPAEMLVGAWDYAMRYPSGDEVAMVRILSDDGSGRQYAKDAGEGSSQSFTWEVANGGKSLVLTFSETMRSTYGIVRLREDEHVLRNAHGLEETSARR